jgi:hypothetical protein
MARAQSFSLALAILLANNRKIWNRPEWIEKSGVKDHPADLKEEDVNFKAAVEEWLQTTSHLKKIQGGPCKNLWTLWAGIVEGHLKMELRRDLQELLQNENLNQVTVV